MGDRIAEADRLIDRALQLWRKHPGVWNTRVLLLALTGRTEAALAMLAPDLPQPDLPPSFFALLRTTFSALASGSATDIIRATDAQRAAAAISPSNATNAIMYLTALRDLDGAYRVAEGYLARQGPVAVRLQTMPDQPIINDQRWRKTMMLFLTAMAPFRADRRFTNLCDEIGLSEYWRAAGVTPDFRC